MINTPKLNITMKEIEMLSDKRLCEKMVVKIEARRSINMPIDNLILWFIAIDNIRKL